jgi:3-oxoacyl-[acyl-carrier protein] reductase
MAAMKDKTIVVVGGSTGIGGSLLALLSEAGADVRHFSRSAKLPRELAGVRHASVDAVTDPFPAEMIPERVDGLVYCPGSIRLRPFARLKEKDFLADFHLNVLGAVRTVQAFLPGLKKAPGGAAIVLFSTVAVQTGMPFHASVASTKGALEGLTRSLAAELAPGIRVNAVAPSLTDTPLAARLLADEAKREASAQRHPLKRVGTVHDIAGRSGFFSVRIRPGLPVRSCRLTAAWDRSDCLADRQPLLNPPLPGGN